MTREKIAEILRDNIKFSGQVGDYVIHGAIDKIMSEHYKAINRLDDQFNAVMDEVNNLSNDVRLGLNEKASNWIDKYAKNGTVLWRDILTERKLL